MENLIHLFAKLPGLGPRSARRIVLHLLRQKEKLMLPLAESLRDTAENIRVCSECGNLDLMSPCAICSDDGREEKIICIVEHVADLWAMERSHCFKGRYHVLGGTLSALDGIRPEDLRISELVKRSQKPEIQEIILALNATVDGQTTAHYIMQNLRREGLKITRLAQGVPMGGELDYLDDGTLATALQARNVF
jgi:recombination protein RecR